MNRMSIAVAMAGLAIASLFVIAPAANAAPVKPPPGYNTVAHCTGTPIYTHVLESPLGETQGLLQVWYADGAGGTYCAQTFDAADGSHPMNACIRRWDWSTVWCDAGTFTTYAGGVEVYGGAPHCVTVSGYLAMGSSSLDKFRWPAGSTPRVVINKDGVPC
jgi:hypothetical protein